MQDSKVCISRNQAFIIGFVLIVAAMVLLANYINNHQLYNRSRAAGADLNGLPAVGFTQRAQSMNTACGRLKGYLALTAKDDRGNVVFDRFSGHYYSLEKVNPVVTPPVGEPMAAYCAVSGKPGANWCKTITSESACRADCVWVQQENCSVCAPKGVEASLICQP